MVKDRIRKKDTSNDEKKKVAVPYAVRLRNRAQPNAESAGDTAARADRYGTTTILLDKFIAPGAEPGQIDHTGPLNESLLTTKERIQKSGAAVRLSKLYSVCFQDESGKQIDMELYGDNTPDTILDALMRAGFLPRTVEPHIERWTFAIRDWPTYPARKESNSILCGNWFEKYDDIYTDDTLLCEVDPADGELFNVFLKEHYSRSEAVRKLPPGAVLYGCPEIEDPILHTSADRYRIRLERYNEE